MSCDGKCGHPECRTVVAGVEGADDVAGAEGAGEVVAGPGEFWSDLFSGRDPIAADRARRAAAGRPAPARTPPRPAPGRPAPPRPAPGRPARPAPARTPPRSASTAAAPPRSMPLPAGMARCDPWRRDGARPSIPAGGTVQRAPGGWWRVCYPAPPADLAPVESLCAVMGPEEVALMDAEVMDVWLACGPSPDDFERFLVALVEFGREDEAQAYAESVDVVGAIPREVRAVDDVLSALWGAVRPIVPGGEAIDTLHRARRQAMYGPERPPTRPTRPAPRSTAPAAGPAVAMVREAQRAVRLARKGDPAATAAIVRVKEAAGAGNEAARRRWAVYVATMRDHDRRVDAATEGASPMLVLPTGRTAPAAPGRAAPGRAAARPATPPGGGGLFGGLFGGGRS